MAIDNTTETDLFDPVEMDFLKENHGLTQEEFEEKSLDEVIALDLPFGMVCQEFANPDNPGHKAIESVHTEIKDVCNNLGNESLYVFRVDTQKSGSVILKTIERALDHAAIVISDCSPSWKEAERQLKYFRQPTTFESIKELITGEGVPPNLNAAAEMGRMAKEHQVILLTCNSSSRKRYLTNYAGYSWVDYNLNDMESTLKPDLKQAVQQSLEAQRRYKRDEQTESVRGENAIILQKIGELQGIMQRRENSPTQTQIIQTQGLVKPEEWESIVDGLYNLPGVSARVEQLTDDESYLLKLYKGQADPSILIEAITDCATADHDSSLQAQRLADRLSNVLANKVSADTLLEQASADVLPKPVTTNYAHRPSIEEILIAKSVGQNIPHTIKKRGTVLQLPTTARSVWTTQDEFGPATYIVRARGKQLHFRTIEGARFTEARHECVIQYTDISQDGTRVLSQDERKMILWDVDWGSLKATPISAQPSRGNIALLNPFVLHDPAYSQWQDTFIYQPSGNCQGKEVNMRGMDAKDFAKRTFVKPAFSRDHLYLPGRNGDVSDVKIMSIEEEEIKAKECEKMQGRLIVSPYGNSLISESQTSPNISFINIDKDIRHELCSQANQSVIGVSDDGNLIATTGNPRQIWRLFDQDTRQDIPLSRGRQQPLDIPGNPGEIIFGKDGRTFYAVHDDCIEKYEVVKK
jgi:hypothetical protein